MPPVDQVMPQVKLPTSFYSNNEVLSTHDLTTKMKSSVFSGSHLEPHKFMPY